jgi:DNA-binding CsgD family transcriptional regulator
MVSLSGIVRERSAPGILLVDLEGRLVFANEQALELLATHRPAELEAGVIPESIQQLCRQVHQGGEAAMTIRPPNLSCLDLEGSAFPPCSLRAFPLGAPGSNQPASHIMVLMERVVAKHQINLEKARTTFQLSKREAEVLNLIGLGFTNKKISDALFLSEHTVKDHLKNIMKKLGAGSRAEVVASLR